MPVNLAPSTLQNRPTPKSLSGKNECENYEKVGRTPPVAKNTAELLPLLSDFVWRRGANILA